MNYSKLFLYFIALFFAIFSFGQDVKKDSLLVIKTENTDIHNALFVEANEITISGKITDLKNKLIAGAYIKILGISKSVQSDLDGKYSIKCNKGDFLVFSFVGMLTQKIKVQEAQNIDIKLKKSPAFRCK